MSGDDLRQPPCDLAAEMAALGAAIQSPEALAAVVDVCGPERFYRPAHEKILAAALALYGQGEPVDPVSVAAELGRRSELLAVGGAPYLHTLMESVPTAANVGYYAEIVADKAILRDLADAGTFASQLAYEGSIEPITAVERARQRLDAVAAGARTDEAVYTASQVTDRATERYRSPKAPGLRTGWRDLDSLIPGGLRPGWLVIVGARPKVGKSFLGVSLPLYVAQMGNPAAICSLEMPEAELTDRLISQVSGVELDALRACKLNDYEWQDVNTAASKIRPLPLTILDSKRQTLSSIKSRVRDLKRGVGCDLLVIDYLTLITPADTRAPRQEQVATLSRGLKLLANELKIPVVALAQINRGPEGRSDRRPLPSDLRESGAIEADADQVWLLHHDEDVPGEIEVNVAMNRHGSPGVAHLAWNPRLARIRDLIRFPDTEAA